MRSINKKVFGVPLAMLLVLALGASVAFAAALTYEGEVDDSVVQVSTAVKNAWPNGATNDLDYWKFCGSAGDVVSIEVHRTTYDMDPIALVGSGLLADGDDFWSWWSSNGLASADDNNGIPHGVGGSYADPRIDLTLPADGEYTLVVGDYASAGPNPQYDVHTTGIDGCVLTKAQILKAKGVRGKGLDKAPGLQRPFNERSRASEAAGGINK